MRTSAEIRQEQDAAAERQRRYDFLVNQKTTVEHAIKILEAKIAERKPGADALSAIAELLPGVPADLNSRSFGREIPGGYELRELLIHLVSRGREDHGKRLGEFEAELKKAKALRTANAKALKEEFSEAA